MFRLVRNTKSVQHRLAAYGMGLSMAWLLALDVRCQRRTAWNLPPLGMVEYRRVVDRFELVPKPDRSATVLVPTAAEGGARWRVTRKRPGGAWASLQYEDAGWGVERGGFGSSAPGGNGGEQRSVFRGNGANIWLRVRFVPRRRFKVLALTLAHDDSVEAYVNGLPVAVSARNQGYHVVPCGEPVLDSLQLGAPNVLAIHCKNNTGAALVDAGLTGFLRRLSKGQKLPVQGGAIRKQRRGRDSLTWPLRRPPCLFAGALDPKRRRLDDEPIDFRDLPMYVATDWTEAVRGGSYRRTFRRVHLFGDVTISGRVTAPDEEHRQQMTLKLRRSDVRPAGESKRYFDSNIARYYRRSLIGELQVTRTVDPVNGWITGFQHTLDLAIDPQPATSRRLVLAETWSKPVVRPHRDPKFRADVVRAIETGAQWVLRDLAKRTSKHLRHRAIGHPAVSANTGRLAMGVLTLLKAGIDPRNKTLVAALNDLRRREIRDTYSLANAIMAIEALYAPQGEREDLLSGRIDRPYTRKLPAADLALLSAWADRLMTNLDTRVDAGYVARFNYRAARRYDNSVNQYGLLGIYAAQLCGYKVSPGFWQSAAKHLLLDQTELGRTIELTLHQSERIDKTVASSRVSLAGWSYIGEVNGLERERTGAMTCAGLTGLALARAGLRLHGRRSGPLFGQIEAAMSRGFAWLYAHFDVANNRGLQRNGYYWRYYYLYSLERSCELAGVRRLGSRDWYFEGAMTLMSWQNPDGSFRAERSERPNAHGWAIERTCFGVLFLKKAALPVLTAR